VNPRGVGGTSGGGHPCALWPPMLGRGGGPDGTWRPPVALEWKPVMSSFACGWGMDGKLWEKVGSVCIGSVASR
jgi:hypothetical protein